jgi:hypothetical protein
MAQASGQNTAVTSQGTDEWLALLRELIGLNLIVPKPAQPERKKRLNAKHALDPDRGTPRTQRFGKNFSAFFLWLKFLLNICRDLVRQTKLAQT